MKRLLALLLALCLLLSACTAATGPDAVPSGPAPSDPVQSDPIPSDPAPSESEPSRCDAHGDEYITKLTDLEELAQGKQVLAYEVGPADWSDSTWDEEYVSIFGYDMRSCDVSDKDLTGIENWIDITFNSDTRWPSAGKLPEGFDPEAVLELGKDPGLGIRALHDQGITGEGVGVAIIDQTLYTGHEQYRDNLMLYECVHCDDMDTAVIHGPAVSSIAVGKDVGVAPGAKLYYIATNHAHATDGGYENDMSILADCVYRVLEINRSLPQGEKIRVISISFGPNPDMPGYEDMAEAVRAAREEGVLVLTTENEGFYPGFKFFGMSRDSLADPNDPRAYGPARWLNGFSAASMDDYILVPMGSRTCAACTGEANYEWNYEGGLSWAVPWLAGFYALCCQADPGCTPERFFKAVRDTASVRLTHTYQKRANNGKPSPNLEQEYCVGRIIDPAAAIEALKNQ